MTAATREETTLDQLAANWAAVGAHFAVHPTREPVDLERLLVATAALASNDERLFVVAASWLAAHYAFVNGRRLRRLAARVARQDVEGSAVLGAMLDLALTGVGPGGLRPDGLEGARERCRSRTASGLKPRPLFHVMTELPVLRARVQRHALPLFTRWGFWHDDATLKLEAVRPLSWILTHVPALRVRAFLGPTLEADILAAALADVAPGHRQREGPPTAWSVARAYDVSYAGAHEATERLVRRGLLVREHAGARQLLRPTAVALLLTAPMHAQRARTGTHVA